MSERILSFAYLMCPSVSGPKALKRKCLRFAIFNFSEKLQNIFEIRLKKYGVFVQKSLSLKKNISKEKIRRQFFVVYVLVCPLSKFEGNRTKKWPLSFSLSQCPFKVKKLIRENSAKYVNQTSNFYFRSKLKTAISLPIFNLLQ